MGTCASFVTEQDEEVELFDNEEYPERGKRPVHLDCNDVIYRYFLKCAAEQGIVYDKLQAALIVPVTKETILELVDKIKRARQAVHETIKTCLDVEFGLTETNYDDYFDPETLFGKAVEPLCGLESLLSQFDWSKTLYYHWAPT